MSTQQVEDAAPQTRRLLLSSLKETQDKPVPDDKKGHPSTLQEPMRVKPGLLRQVEKPGTALREILSCWASPAPTPNFDSFLLGILSAQRTEGSGPLIPNPGRQRPEGSNSPTGPMAVAADSDFSQHCQHSGPEYETSHHGPRSRKGGRADTRYS